MSQRNECRLFPVSSGSVYFHFPLAFLEQEDGKGGFKLSIEVKLSGPKWEPSFPERESPPGRLEKLHIQISRRL